MNLIIAAATNGTHILHVSADAIFTKTFIWISFTLFMFDPFFRSYISTLGYYLWYLAHELQKEKKNIGILGYD